MKKCFWTEKEKELLKVKYSTASWEELKKFFKPRSRNSIRMIAGSLGLKRDLEATRENSWLPKEDEVLKKIYSDPSVSWEEILKVVPRHSKNAIEIRATRILNLERPRADSPIAKDGNPTSQLPPADPEEKAREQMLEAFGEEFLKPAKLPQMKAEKPFVIEYKTGEVLVLNSPLDGSLAAEDDKKDIVKNALRLAEVSKHDAVIVTGDLMWMLTQKYGTQRPAKTQISGLKIDPKVVEESYPESVRNDPEFQHVEERIKKRKPVYVPSGIRLKHNIKMIRETFTDDKGKPVYNGPVYIVFGKLEYEMIVYFINEFLRVEVLRDRGWPQKRIREITAEWRKAKSQEEKDMLNKKIKDFQKFLSNVVMGKASDEYIEQTRELITAYIIRKYEESIPNSKVVSVGDAYFKLGKRSIMVTTDKNKETWRGKLAAGMVSKTLSYSKGHNPKDIPDVMLGMGLNPACDVLAMSYQASEEQDHKLICWMLGLPMCIDAERYRDVIRNQAVLKDLITRVGSASGFESGVVTFSWPDALKTPIIGFWSSDVLKNSEIFKSREGIEALVNGKKIEHKMIYIYKEGCTHVGANDVKHYSSPEDSKGIIRKYHHQLAKEFLLAANAPIAMYLHDGDATQQANHEYQKNKHPKYLSPEEQAVEFQKINDAKISDGEKFKRARQLSLEQRLYGGTLQLDEQVKSYVQSCEPYLEFYVRILELGKKLKISFKGTLSLIIHIMGNHCKNTYKHQPIVKSDAKEISEGLKKSLLRYLMDHKLDYLRDDVERELTYPQNGPLGEARGSFGVPGYQRYNLILKHKQGDMDKTQKNSQNRSQDENEVGLPILNYSGDNHKGGVRATRNKRDIKTGGQQGEGSYGREIDGSEQNVFSMVHGVPVGGFSCGPDIYIFLDAETMRNFALNPAPIDGKKLFKNALE